MGHRRLARPSLVAVSDDGIQRRPDGKVHLVRVNTAFGDDGRFRVTPVGAQGSHQLAATALADAIAIVPDGDGIPPGGDVAVLDARRLMGRGSQRSRRPLRSRHPRPADLGHRPLQLPLHVLHAGRGHDVAAPQRGADVRGDRAPGPDLRRALRRRGDPPHRWRADGQGPPAGARRQAGRARRRRGDDHQRGDAARHGEAPAHGRAAPGQHQPRFARPGEVRADDTP